MQRLREGNEKGEGEGTVGKERHVRKTVKSQHGQEGARSRIRQDHAGHPQETGA